MSLITRLKYKFFYKHFNVEFGGKKTQIRCYRFEKQDESPQEFMDRHAVICGNCGELMLPGDALWLMIAAEKDLKKTGVLKIKIDEKDVLVACLRRDCVATAACMCGRLHEDRQVEFFESPMQKALRTGEITIVSDMKTYKG